MDECVDECVGGRLGAARVCRRRRRVHPHPAVAHRVQMHPARQVVQAVAAQIHRGGVDPGAEFVQQHTTDRRGGTLWVRLGARVGSVKMGENG